MTLAMPEPHERLAGQRLGSVEVVQKLGAGAMGIVYRARHDTHGDVCIKVILPEFSRRDDVVRRYHREAQAAMRINHPHVVRGFGIEQSDGYTYLIQEFVPGGDLYNYVRQMGGRLPLPEALRVTREIAIGLTAAHQAGMVHRDLKPGNVLLDAQRRCKVGDLGLVLQTEGDPLDGLTVLTAKGQVLGTPYYMAPEQWRESHDVDHRADIYSLGVILHELISGRHPISGKSLTQIMRGHLQMPPPPIRSLVPEVPEGVEKLILDLMQKEIPDRPESCAVVVFRIEELARSMGLSPAIEEGIHLAQTMMGTSVGGEGGEGGGDMPATFMDLEDIGAAQEVPASRPGTDPGKASTGGVAAAGASAVGGEPPPMQDVATFMDLHVESDEVVQGPLPDQSAMTMLDVDAAAIDGSGTASPAGSEPAGPAQSPPGTQHPDLDQDAPTLVDRGEAGGVVATARGSSGTIDAEPATGVGSATGFGGDPATGIGGPATGIGDRRPASSGAVEVDQDAPTIKGFVSAGQMEEPPGATPGGTASPASHVAAPASLPPDDPILNSLVGGKFRVTSILGRGGMGMVYRARHTLLERDYALKVLLPKFAQDHEFRTRFLREANAMQAFTHEAAVTVREFGEHEGSLYMALDFAPGETLGRTLRKDGPFTDERLLKLARQILPCLQKAHDAGLVHRDIKPGNIMVEKTADGDRARILDFGIAKVLKDAKDAMGTGEGAEQGAELTGEGQTLGTPHYMSPEQASGDDVDARTDVYAIACVFYECLAGRRPLEAPTQQKLVYKILMDTPEELAKLTEGKINEKLAKAVMWGLAKEPEERPPSAKAFLDALEGAVDVPEDLDLTAKRVRQAAPEFLPPPPPPPSAFSRFLKAVASLALVGALSAGGVGYYFHQQKKFDFWGYAPIEDPARLAGGRIGPVINPRAPIEIVELTPGGDQKQLLGVAALEVRGKLSRQGEVRIGEPGSLLTKRSEGDGSFSVRIALSPQASVVEVRAGEAPNEHRVDIPVEIDLAAPVVAIEKVAEWGGAAIDVRAKIEDAHPRLVRLWLVVNDQPTSAEPVEAAPDENGVVTHSFEPPAVDGGVRSLAIRVEGEDSVGNVGKAVLDVPIDRTAPTLAVTEPADGLVTRAPSLAVRGKLTAADVTGEVIVAVFKGNEELARRTARASEDGVVTVDGLDLPGEDGSYRIEMRARDRVGNEGKASCRLLVDRTPPTVAVVAPVDGTRTREQELAVRVEASDAGSGLASVRFAGADLEDRSGLWVGAWKLADGKNTGEAIARDAAGNEAKAEVSVRCDRKAPGIVKVERDPAGDKIEAKNLTVTVFLDAPGKVKIGGVDAQPVGGDPLRQQAVVGLADGENEIPITVTDALGNTADAPAIRVQKVKPFEDVMPEGTWWTPSKAQLAYAKQTGLPLWFEDARTGLKFVLIPPGPFKMGSPEEEEGHDSDELLHDVKITEAFYMSATEVTNAAFRRFLPAHDSGELDGNTLNEDAQPVVNVTWEEANGFCESLSATAGEPGLYRLPTEAQWEYACRAGGRGAYFWGNFAGAASNYANVLGPATKKKLDLPADPFPKDDPYDVTAPVGQLGANPFGLHDMIGNVFEWCADWYDYYDPAVVDDPSGPASPSPGAGKITRGGAYDEGPRRTRMAARSAVKPKTGYPNLGFRVVMRHPPGGK